MPIGRFITFLFLAVSFGLSFAVVSARSLSEDAVRLIELSSSGYEHGLAVAFSPDGGQIAVGVSSGIALYNSQSLFREQFIETGTWSRSVVYSPDGQTIAAGLFDGTARLWRHSDGSLLRVFEGHAGWVRSVLFSHDGKIMITAADDDSVRVWNVSDGSLKLTISQLTGIRVATLSPDNQTLAVGLQDSSIKLLSVSNGEVLRIFTGHEDWVRSLAFSPDGHILASGAFDATARLWNVDSGRLEYTLSGHESSVLALDFSPDGGTLATGSVDATVKLWNVYDGNLIRTLIGHTDFVYGVAFSPDGMILVSGASDNTARLWDLSSSEKVPVLQPPTSSDCRDCHHPRGVDAPARVIQISCEACHAGGIGLNWCASFPRSAQAVSEASYLPPADPVGLPISSENIAVQINYPSNGETLYSSGHNLSPVFVVGNVFYPGDLGAIKVRMEIWSDGQLTKELFTRPAGDGRFTFSLAINPEGAMIVAGAKAADPDCASCHEDFKSQASFPDGKVHFVITAFSSDGDQATDDRWITIDTSNKADVEVRVVDKESGAPIPGLSVHAATILYEWRDRYANEVSDMDGIATLSLESLTQSPTKYEITVPPTSLNGYLYENVDPVILNLSPRAMTHDPVTIYVTARTGQITGHLSVADTTDALDIWAINIPYGMSHKTSVVHGEFIFDALPNGKYKVLVDPTVEQLGYHSEPYMVDLTQNAQAAISVQMDKTAANWLTGKVKDKDGAFLPFGWLTAASDTTVQLNPFEGTYRLYGLNPGNVTVIASAPGYFSQAQVVDLRDGINDDFDYYLVPQPETNTLPWGDGRIILPPQTDYELTESTITLKRGWIWGDSIQEQNVTLQVAGMQIALGRGSFALQDLPLQEGWFYLLQGEAVIHTADGLQIPVSSGQMVALSDQYSPVPVPYQKMALAALHSEADPLLQNKWEPTVVAQTRDRLAQIGISVAQVITFVTYMLVLIVIVALLIGGIYSIWKYIRKPSR